MATARVNPDYLPKGFNRYVSGAAYVGDLHRGNLVRVVLGAPATLDADGILNDADNATTNAGAVLTAFATTYDANAGLSGRYGRNVTMVASTTASNTITVKGYDWLGQPMLETFTLNATTTVQGSKAFKYVTSVKINTGTGTTTIDVGWGNRLGLPFKALDVKCAYEDNVMTSFGTQFASVVTAGVQAGAGTTAANVTVPFDGWYCGASWSVTTAQATTLATIDFIYDGTGTAALDFIVPATEAIGEGGSAVVAPATWLAVVGGRTVTYTSDSGGDTGVITVNSLFARCKPGAAFQAPVDTDPQTATTRDPRGLYTPLTACDGAIVHEIEFLPDYDNTFGVAHYFA